MSDVVTGAVQPYSSPPEGRRWCEDNACDWAASAHWHAEDGRPQPHPATVAGAIATLPPGEHYRRRGGIEPIDFIVSNNLDFLEGNIVKYVSRWRHKDGVRDLGKALQYLQWLIAQAERAAVEAEGANGDRSHGG